MIMDLKTAFESYTGWTYDPPGSGYYNEVLVAFTAGWNAAQQDSFSGLSPLIRGGEVEVVGPESLNPKPLER